MRIKNNILIFWLTSDVLWVLGSKYNALIIAHFLLRSGLIIVGTFVRVNTITPAGVKAIKRGARSRGTRKSRGGHDAIVGYRNAIRPI